MSSCGLAQKSRRIMRGGEGEVPSNVSGTDFTAVKEFGSEDLGVEGQHPALRGLRGGVGRRYAEYCGVSR